MMKLVHNKDALANLNKYTFSAANMKKGYAVPLSTQVSVPTLAAPIISAPIISAPILAAPILATPILATPTISAPTLAPPTLATPITTEPKSTKPFTPFQKDKLFWCFFIILKGYEEYEMNHSNAFSVEKQLKIETVEKLKSIKEKLKELKLKRTELEDELVNKQTITLKGLCALCLVHNVSITYVFGRKYCEINASEAGASEAGASEAGASEAGASEAGAGTSAAERKGIIVQNAKKEDSLKSTNGDEAYLSQVRAEYWLIENIQKPLKASSAYTLVELQDICQKLQLETHTQVNEKSKAKPKTKLYEEILQCI
jgi:hypothetical protein